MKFKNYPEIQTERLTLRILNTKDVAIVFALRSNVQVQKYIAREPLKVISEAEEKTKELVQYIDNMESISWVICCRDNAKKIGSICFWNFSTDRKTAEVGYDLLPEYQHKGIMNEALNSVLHFGCNTLELKTVEAFTSRHNKGSVALLEKNNFKLQRDRIDEGFPDNIIFRFVP